MPVLTEQRVKGIVRKRDGFRCAKCGVTNGEHKARYGKQLHVHRITPGSPYTVAGCVTLCYTCHGPEPRRRVKVPRPYGPNPTKLQLLVPDDIRRRLKVQAFDRGLNPSDLAVFILGHVLSELEAGRTPLAVAKGIEECRAVILPDK